MLPSEFLDLFFRNEKIQIIILVLGLILYLLVPLNLKSYVGLFVGLYILISVGYDFYGGSKEKGFKEEAKEWIKALAVVLIIFLGLRLALHTENPISAVVSCSMVPNLMRGDLILVEGASTINSQININLPEQELSSLFKREFVYYYNGKAFARGNDSLYTICSKGPINDVCSAFRREPNKFSEAKGPFKFNFGTCVREGKIEYNVPCITSLSIKGKNYSLKNEGDVIVYSLGKNYLFGRLGDIVHRAIVKINVGNESFYLTKGDNNNIFDIEFTDGQYYNIPPNKKDVKGKIVFKVPYLGYYKLFLTPYLSENEICNEPLKLPS